MKTELKTLIAAMQALARDIQIDYGVANAAITEAAQVLACQAARIQQLEGEAKVLRDLLTEACGVIDSTESDDQIENEMLMELYNQIKAALRGAS